MKPDTRNTLETHYGKLIGERGGVLHAAVIDLLKFILKPKNDQEAERCDECYAIFPEMAHDIMGDYHLESCSCYVPAMKVRKVKSDKKEDETDYAVIVRRVNRPQLRLSDDVYVHIVRARHEENAMLGGVQMVMDPNQREKIHHPDGLRQWQADNAHVTVISLNSPDTFLFPASVNAYRKEGIANFMQMANRSVLAHLAEFLTAYIGEEKSCGNSKVTPTMLYHALDSWASQNQDQMKR